jgi:hypothetical protein
VVAILEIIFVVVVFFMQTQVFLRLAVELLVELL